MWREVVPPPSYRFLSTYLLAFPIAHFLIHSFIHASLHSFNRHRLNTNCMSGDTQNEGLGGLRRPDLVLSLPKVTQSPKDMLVAQHRTGTSIWASRGLSAGVVGEARGTVCVLGCYYCKWQGDVALHWMNGWLALSLRWRSTNELGRSQSLGWSGGEASSLQISQ